MSIPAFWRLPYLFFASGLSAAQAANTDYELVISLSRADCDLVIDARPYWQQGAGYSSVDLRYRYLGIELNALPQNYYYTKLLLPYIKQASAYLHDTGLYEDNQGRHWQTELYSKRGEVLFLPPSQFTDKQVQHLAACIYNNQQQLLVAFTQVKVAGRHSPISGLERGIALDGIAFLIHADIPLVDIYADDWQVLLIEQDSRVLLYRHYNGIEAPPEEIILGQVVPEPSSGRKAKLLLQPITDKQGSVISVKNWRKTLSYLLNRKGNSLLDNYNILSQ